MEFENTSAEMEEVAELPETEEVNETGVEEPEFAEPESESEEPTGKTEADAAFAEMRRRAEEAEREKAEAIAELERVNAMAEARAAAIESMDIDDIDALADQAGISREEVIAAIEQKQSAANAEIESRRKDLKISELEEKLNEVNAEKEMQNDLVLLQGIDPTIKSLDDLGKDYGEYIAAGLSAKQAYYAIKGEELTTKATPAVAPGKIENSEPPERELTEAEIDAMTPEEQRKNYKKIMAFWDKHNK